MEQEIIEKAKIQSENIVEVLSQVKGLLNVKGKKTENLLTLIMYIGVTNNDVQLLYKNLCISKIPYEKRMYSRLIAMKLKEFFDDYGKFLNRSVVEAKNNRIDTELTFKEINAKLKSLYKIHYNDLKSIRHFSASHTHEDPRIMAAYFLEELKIDIRVITNDIIMVFEEIMWKLFNYMKESLGNRGKR